FRPELLGQSKLFDDLCNMDAGSSAPRRVGVNDRLRGEERAFEILDRSYVEFNSGGHHNADTGLANRGLAASLDFSLVDERGHRLRGADDQVGFLAADGPFIHRADRAVVKD